MREYTDVAVLEGSLRPQGDLDSLFTVGGYRLAVAAVARDMDDPKIHLRLDLPRAGSHTVPSGERDITRTDIEFHFLQLLVRPPKVTFSLIFPISFSDK